MSKMSEALEKYLTKTTDKSICSSEIQPRRPPPTRHPRFLNWFHPATSSHGFAQTIRRFSGILDPTHPAPLI